MSVEKRDNPHDNHPLADLEVFVCSNCDIAPHCTFKSPNSVNTSTPEDGKCPHGFHAVWEKKYECPAEKSVCKCFQYNLHISKFVCVAANPHHIPIGAIREMNRCPFNPESIFAVVDISKGKL